MISKRQIAKRLIDSRKNMLILGDTKIAPSKVEAEGGCGVIGIACNEPIAGRHLLQSLKQMRNRGNGKGGGAAMVGLEPGEFGITPEILHDDYLLAVAYLEPDAQSEIERNYIESGFEVDHIHTFETAEVAGLEMAPPHVVAYFVRPKSSAVEEFVTSNKLEGLSTEMVEDEFVYRNTFALNQASYASLGEKKAFVLSHGKDMLVLKMVGFGDDVIKAYRLEDFKAHVWIGHHRYPTKGRVWHPGGAHPFVGMHDALVHNGDFANYSSVCSYLAQSNIKPLFLTDTEVSVLVFDLLYRIYGYPLEYVIEALAPTTERDFMQLPESKRDIYRMLQITHMHGSPDGPWFFLIAQSETSGAGPREARLIGITDTSMLRPQVFALQMGEPGQPSVGFAASEKQAIDAALESLASEDNRFWTHPDIVWNARGGSYTDGGAFIFSVRRYQDGRSELWCQDKFGRQIEIGETGIPFRENGQKPTIVSPSKPEGTALEVFEWVKGELPRWSYENFRSFLDDIVAYATDEKRVFHAIELLGLILDRRYPTGDLRRSSLLSLCDRALDRIFEGVHDSAWSSFVSFKAGARFPELRNPDQTVLVDGSAFEPEGEFGLARGIQKLVAGGFRRIIVHSAKGHRFLGNGLGPNTEGVRLEVFGSSGDYLASGIDGAEMIVHGSGQDQLGQIMKRGKLVVHGDVGQTFMYAAKGGEVYVLGSAAGRPLINAVGKPRVVINGTCLDYLAESFMAGDPLNGGGFVVVNGVRFADDGRFEELETPYPGGNLFSLASGGAIFVRDPHGRVGEDQLNGGRFKPFEPIYWDLIKPHLEENERLFGISIDWLLQVDGERKSPDSIYRAILPSDIKALQPEEAWVAH